MKVAKNPGAAGTRKAKPSFPEALAVLVPLSFTQHMLNIIVNAVVQQQIG